MTTAEYNALPVCVCASNAMVDPDFKFEQEYKFDIELNSSNNRPFIVYKNRTGYDSFSIRAFEIFFLLHADWAGYKPVLEKAKEYIMRMEEHATELRKKNQAFINLLAKTKKEK